MKAEGQWYSYQGLQLTLSLILRQLFCLHASLVNQLLLKFCFHVSVFLGTATLWCNILPAVYWAKSLHYCCYFYMMMILEWFYISLSSIGCVTQLLSLPFFLPGPAGANYKFGYFVPCLHLLHLIFAQIYSSLHDLIGHAKIFCSNLLHDHKKGGKNHCYLGQDSHPPFMHAKA